MQDAQTEEVQAYFCQWGPVNGCQLAHNDSALIALISKQGQVLVCWMILCLIVLGQLAQMQQCMLNWYKATQFHNSGYACTLHMYQF